MTPPVNKDMLADRCHSMIHLYGSFPIDIEESEFIYWLGKDIGEKFYEHYHFKGKIMPRDATDMAEGVMNEYPDLFPPAPSVE